MRYLLIDLAFVSVVTLVIANCGKATEDVLSYKVQIENVTVEGVVEKASYVEVEKLKVESAILYSEPL
jgi:hypothetical protein